MYGRLGLGNHVGPKDPTRPELCPQCKKIENQSRGLCVLPTEIKKLRGVQIKSLVCGPAHNMFVTKKSGRLFVWGKCHEGQAGVGRRKGPSLDSCIDFPIEITTISDIPANSGLGSSSSFAVGLINAILALLRIQMSKYQIASLAAKIEIDILKRNIGKQDHFAATYGNLNIFKFFPDESVEVKPVFYNKDIKHSIEDNILLFWTKIKRNASKILSSVDNNLLKNIKILEEMRDLVEPMNHVFVGKQNLNSFGEILDKSWKLKKSLSSNISNNKIDLMYDKAKKLGATGGKVLGAGGGGFLLLYIEKNKQKNVIKEFKNIPHFKFNFDTSGTRITYYDSE